MNYRHAFHAGNFADVLKHVVLLRVLGHLLKKDTPFRVVDTHAGIGLYDLSADEAERTGEWRDGIGRLDAPFAPAVEVLLAPYRAALAETRRRFGAGAYPGSPLIALGALRRQDRALFVELHPQDRLLLEEALRGTRNAKVLHLDGWTALHALVPPTERRGLVLVDPPYEARGELDRLGMELAKAWRKWPTGIFLGWYPIKDPGDADAAARTIAEAGPKGLRLELFVDRPDDAGRLVGCGLFVLNPPWTLREEAEALLPPLSERLARGGYGAFRCEPLREAD
jgi:23S rRNA (adenine2030-N6)-methyltransferase